MCGGGVNTIFHLRNIVLYLILFSGGATVTAAVAAAAFDRFAFGRCRAFF
jgi:hypothetical protein